MKSDDKIKCQICGSDNMLLSEQHFGVGETHEAYSCPDCGAMGLFVRSGNIKGLEYKVIHKKEEK